MPLPVTVYRSSDAGAPPLEFTPSSVINILKKCLVEGYGTKQPLGWTIAFEDAANIAIAFRNDPAVGTGGYVKFWSPTGDAVGTNLLVNACRDMVDINTLINPVGLRPIPIGAGANYQNSWMVIGTSRSAWIIINSSYSGADDYDLNSSSAGYQANQFFGDIDSVVPNDAGAFILFTGDGINGDSNTPAYNRYVGSTSTFYAFMISTDLSDQTVVEYRSFYPAVGTSTKKYNDPESVGSPHILYPFSLRVGSANYDPSVAYPPHRGIIPGLYGSSQWGYCDKKYPLDLDIGGVMYTALRGLYIPTAWINMEEWYV
ncbi:hypothetical protein [Shewanella algae]|uniref:hypothetical protein n=1 Tax=Shewanella algae TaxID=38313 RepID=UPI003003BEC7